MDDFETFAREKIARLRAEAEALEKTLKEYQSAMGRAVRSSSGGETKGGGFGAVLEALEEAGAPGLSLDEMIEAADRKGFDVKRNTLRSQLFTAKQKGQVEQMEAGRYRAPQPVARSNPAPVMSAEEAFAHVSEQQRQPRPWERPPAPPPSPADDDIPF